MGLTHIEVTVANPGNLKKANSISLLIDSGAVYSIVPKSLLAELGVRAHSTRTFTLADGSEIKRKIGDLVFKLNGHQGASPVIFGEKGDSTLLGMVSLEALGLLLDPIRREIRPLPMVLGYHQPRTDR
jgi:clan AA aspartic protease